MDKKKKYTEAKEAYYAGSPIMSDAEFDKLEEEIAQEDPTWEGLQKVGAPASGTSIPHQIPMLSLKKEKSTEGLDRWRKKKGGIQVITPKLDGLSMCLWYLAGKLVRAGTRGDGHVGQDTTRKMRLVAPMELNHAFTGLVRGECVIPKAKEEELRQEAMQRGVQPYANLRNAVASFFNESDVSMWKLKYTVFIAYAMLRDDPVDKYFGKTYMEDMRNLQELGFVIPTCIGIGGAYATQTLVDRLYETRSGIPFEVDGAVVRMNENSEYEQEGYSTHAPNGAIAWKYGDQGLDVEIGQITWSVGPTAITPVVWVTPTRLDGAIISKASGHSVQNLVAVHAVPGNKVELVRSGGVIPKIGKSRFTAENEMGIQDKVLACVPETCPECGASTKLNKTFTKLTCSNKVCPAKIARAMEVSLKALGIKFFGGSACSQLVKAGVLQTEGDIFDLTEDMIAKTGFSTLVARKMMGEVERAKRNDLSNVIQALNIPRVGRGGAEAIAAATGTLENFLGMSREDLASATSTTTPKIATEMFKGYQHAQDAVRRWIAAGLTVASGMEGTAGSGQSGGAGWGICITGTTKVPRSELERMIVKAGHTPKSSVSKFVKYLVTNNPGSTSGKMKKAQKMGTQVITEEQLMDLLGIQIDEEGARDVSGEATF